MEEVHQNISKGLQVIPVRLLDTQVSIDGCIASSTRKLLVLPVWDMKMCLRVVELLSETKVNDVDLVATLANAHQEVVGFDVVVDKVVGMDILYVRYLYLE